MHGFNCNAGAGNEDVVAEISFLQEENIQL